MTQIRFFHHQLYRKVQYFEWILLAIAFAGELIALKFLPADPGAPNIVVSLLMLLIVGALSFYNPVEGTFWDKICFMFMETILLTGATAAGNARFVFPLYTVVLAKSCLVLDKKGLWITGTSALLGQLAWACYKIVITTPNLLKHGLTPLLAVGIGCSAMVLAYVPIAVMILVGTLTLSLVSEQKSRMEAERLSREVEALATELERSRIAREIHDSLGHSLTTLNIQLDLARKFAKDDPGKSQQALDLGKELATQSLNDVRLAVQSIRNSDFNLKEAVEGLVNDVRQIQPIKIRVLSDLPELPPAIGFQLFRVIQECLTNVLKHANASAVTIEVARANGRVQLDFSDNGVGMSNQTGQGYGIKGMQERVESMRGSMSIKAQPDAGTQIQVSIPL